MTEPVLTLSAEDRLDIIELFAQYAWALDLADAPAAVACFAEDGSFDHLWQGRVQGHAAILKNFEQLWYGRPAWWYGRQHLFNHFQFFAETPERARVKSYFQIIQFNTEYNNNFVFGIGTRDDVVVKQTGRWVFHSIHVNAWRSRDDVPWKGEMKLPVLHGKPKPPVAPPELLKPDEKGTEHE